MRRCVHRVLIGIVEFLEQFEERVTASGLYAEVVDVKKVTFAGERYQRHEAGSP
jgi:hypothetical protein